MENRLYTRYDRITKKALQKGADERSKWMRLNMVIALNILVWALAAVIIGVAVRQIFKD